MKLAILSYGHADMILHYAKSLSRYYEIDLIFIFALNKRSESIINFEKEDIQTGFLSNAQVNGILGSNINNFILNDFKVKIFINHNLKIRSLKNIMLSRKIAKALSEYDVIHFNGNDATLLLTNSFLRNKNKVFTIHDVKLHSGEGDKKSFKTAEKICEWIIKSKYQVIIQNKSDYNEIIKRYPDKKNKINLIPFKCLSLMKSYVNDKVNTIKSDLLFFGRISEYKGLKYFVEAVDKVRISCPGVKILIAGSGNIENELNKIRTDKAYTIINRYIPNEEMANYIANTKIVVCPYTDATQSGVVMTSFAFGKPVIASSVGGFIDAIKDKVTGLLVPPRDPESIANAIIELLINDNRVNEMSRNIKKESDDGYLSWGTIVKDAKNMYENAMGI